MTRTSFNTTIEIPNNLRDDIKYLASLEAQQLDIPRLTAKNYLLRLIAREKASLGVE